MQQIHHCFNIIEDAAIELAGTNYYTGSFKQAIIANNKNALDNMPSLDELAAKGAPRLAIFQQACAMYCILGMLKGKLHDPELLALFKKAMPIMDEGRLASDSWGRLEAAEKLYNLMEPLIEEAEKQSLQQAVQQSFQYTKNEQISSGGINSQPQPQPQIEQDFQQKQRKETQEDIEKQIGQQQNSQDTNSEQESSKTETEQDGTEAIQDSEDKESEETQEEENEEDCNSGSRQNTCGGEISEGSQKPNGNNGNQDSVSEAGGEQDNPQSLPEGQSNEREGDEGKEESGEDVELEEMLKRLEEQLEEVKDEAAREEYDRQEQLERDRAIREFARNVRYSDLHKTSEWKSNANSMLITRSRNITKKSFSKSAV